MSKYDEPALAAIAATWAAHLAVLGMAQEVAEALGRSISTDIGTAYLTGQSDGMDSASKALYKAFGGGA